MRIQLKSFVVLNALIFASPLASDELAKDVTPASTISDAAKLISEHQSIQAATCEKPKKLTSQYCNEAFDKFYDLLAAYAGWQALYAVALKYGPISKLDVNIVRSKWLESKTNALAASEHLQEFLLTPDQKIEPGKKP